MNYHELKKMTTPGPLIHEVAPKPWFDEHLWSAGERENGRHVANVDSPHDARLLVHCANNFDKALEALKRLRSIVDTANRGYHTATAPWTAEVQAAEKLIAELEEVP